MQIVVNGIGVISGIGIGVEQNIDSIRQGKDGMGRVTLFPTRHAVPVSEVKLTNNALKELLGLPAKTTYSRTALLGMVAAKEALADANVDLKTQRVGIVSSTSIGGMDLSENFYRSYHNDNSKGRLRDVISHDCGDSTARIAEYLGIDGFATTLSTACSSAANAIMFGARLIKNGFLDCVLVGGSDALCAFTLNGFSSLMILDTEHCRPFDNSRSGLNLGEGAGYLVLQSELTATRDLYCKLSGYANSNDAYHQTASSPDGYGPFLAMSRALEASGLTPADIDYLNVHGTGTNNNDASEGAAVKRLFGSTCPMFSSTKPFTGHTLGAAGGIEAVYSVLSVSRGLVYQNLNFLNPIEESGLIPETVFREGENIRAVMSNSFGFGGNNSSLIFSR